MGLRIYRLTSSNTGGGAGAVGIASTTIVASGTIVGVAWSGLGIAGAGDGYMGIECAINNTALTNALSASGAPSEQLLARFFMAVDNGLTSAYNGFIPMNRKIQQGNTLCINQSQSGTAFGTVQAGFDVMVME